MKQTSGTRVQSYFTDPTLQRSFKGHKDTITSCVFNPNMKQVISGSEDGNVIVWNFKPQMRPYKFIGHKGPVHDVAISPNGNLIASASGDETVRLWNNGVNGNSQTIKAHVAPVKSVDFNNEGRLLLTASDDKIIKIINVADRKFQASLIGHNNWVRCARFSPDSRLIGSASDDHTVKLWDVAQKSTIHTFIDHLEDVNCVRFHPDGTCIASGSVDKKIKLWDIRSKRLIQHYDAHSSSVTSISFHPSGNYLVSASMDATLKIWDLKMGQILYTLYGHEGPVTTVNFSNCGDFFCSGGIDSVLMVWKSNVKNMDEEFEALSKSETKMKSNRKKVEEDIGSYSVPNANLKKTTPANSDYNPNNKFNVTIEEKKVSARPQIPASKHNLLDSSNMFDKLPPELSSTFEKMISQLDLIANTMKIMDQRIATVENQISEIASVKRKKIENVREDSKKSTKSEKNENYNLSGNYYDHNQIYSDRQYNKNKNSKDEFRMSSASSKLDKHEGYFNYADTFKEDKERTSSSNVFNHNLGRSGVHYESNNHELINEYNQNYYEDLDKHEKINDDHFVKNEKVDDMKENENEIRHDEVNEIYEDKNNHVVELNEEAYADYRQDDHMLGHKQQTLEGGITNTNAFKETIDRVIHHNQIDERLENLQRAQNFSDFNMERSFNNMSIETNMNRFKMPIEMSENFHINLENAWNTYQNVPQNTNEINFQQHNNQMNMNPNLMYKMQLNRFPMMTMPNTIHPSLIEFNKQLVNDNKLKTEEKVEKAETKENKNLGGDLYKDIIDVMESQDDERHQKSEFLRFIKKLHTGEIKLNEKDNNIDITEQNLNQYISPEAKMEDVWQKVDSNLNDLDLNYEDILASDEMLTQTKPSLFLNDNPFLLKSDNDINLVEGARDDLNKGNILKARYALEAEVNNNSDNSEAWYLLGKIHTENDRDDLAMQCFLKSLEADPFNSDAILFLGISCTNEFDEFQAMKYLKNWIKLHHIYSKYLDENNPLLNETLIQNEIDMEREDEDYYTRARRIENLKQNFYLEMGNLMEFIGKNEKMVDSDLWTALGIVHFIPHQYERAIECFRKAVQINPKDYNSWNKLGAILAHSKLDVEAINTYKKALEINPNYARCWTNLGIAYLNLDNYNDSRAAFLTALKVYKDIPNAWSYLNSIAIYTKDVTDYELIANRNLEVLLSKYKI